MNVLAIGAHPDDIEFGCGGTLLKLKRAGHRVFMLIMTQGELGGSTDVRSREQKTVSEFLGAEEVIWGGFEDTRVPVVSESINVIDGAIKRTGAEMVFFNHGEDTHQDHRAVARCAISATRYAKWVLAFEVPTSNRFEPDIFVDIGDVIEDKMNLLKLHASQMDRTRIPHLMITESAMACANFRGFQARVKYAEGFMAVRYLLDW